MLLSVDSYDTWVTDVHIDEPDQHAKQDSVEVRSQTVCDNLTCFDII